MAKPERIDLTIQVLPAAKKVFEMMKPSMNVILMDELKQRIIEQLKDGVGLLDLEEAVRVLTELNHEVYKDSVAPPTPYRIKDGLLWFRAKKRWYTVTEHKDVFLSELAGGETR